MAVADRTLTQRFGAEADGLEAKVLRAKQDLQTAQFQAPLKAF